MKVIVCASLIFWGVLRAEEAKLPVESELLLKKLEQFEKDTRQKTEEVIEEKRKQVAATLTQQMRSEAKAGKVEVAIKIRDSIQKLTPAVVVEEVKLEGPKVPTNDQELKAFIEGTIWEWKSGNAITFQQNGEVVKSWGANRPRWEVLDMKIKMVPVNLTQLSDTEVFVFNSKFTEMEATLQGAYKIYGKAKKR